MEQAWAQFITTRLLQMTLVGQVFVVTVAEVDSMEPMTGLEAFKTDGSIELPPCEMIN
jgi:hypothetical protein